MIRIYNRTRKQSQRMPPSHLNNYPKSFNRWGHLRALPLSAPPAFKYAMLGVVTTALYVWNGLYQSWGFETLNNTDFLKPDKNQLLLKKRAFDTLILGNKIQPSEDQVRRRSIF